MEDSIETTVFDDQITPVTGLHIKLDGFEEYELDQLRKRYPNAGALKEVVIQWGGQTREMSFAEFRRRIFDIPASEK